MKLVIGLVTRPNRALVVDPVVECLHVEIMFAKDLVIKLKMLQLSRTADLIVENVKQVVFAAVHLAVTTPAPDHATQIPAILVCN